VSRIITSIALSLALLVAGAAARAEGASWIEDAVRALPGLDLGARQNDPLQQQTVETSTPHPSVARIVVPESDGTSYGSGTLVDVRGEYGLVVTNWHVVENMGTELWVEFPDGFRSAGKLLKVDKDWDLAAIAIWRPNATAVTLADVPPRPGDPLVIAGYGSGPFRAARGECLQYVTPSLSLPLEMVQVTAAARNGDSGGPIFNERGELAGVLFGTGEGITSGSYCGRVNAFLASVLPKEASVEPAPATAPARDPFAKRVAENESRESVVEPIAPLTATHAPPATVQDFGLLDSVDPSPSPPVDAEQTEETPAVENRSPKADPTPVSNLSEVPPPVTLRAMDESVAESLDPEPHHSEVEWLELLGDTRLERVKSAFALLGFCTLIWHTVRIIGGRPAPRPQATAE
jgi:hypothetical protein